MLEKQRCLCGRIVWSPLAAHAAFNFYWKVEVKSVAAKWLDSASLGRFLTPGFFFAGGCLPQVGAT